MKKPVSWEDFARMKSLLEGLGPQNVSGTQRADYYNSSVALFYSLAVFFPCCSKERERHFYLALIDRPRCVLWVFLKWPRKGGTEAQGWFWKTVHLIIRSTCSCSGQSTSQLLFRLWRSMIKIHWSSFARALWRLQFLISIFYSEWWEL